jgi:hypothetical protein
MSKLPENAKKKFGNQKVNIIILVIFVVGVSSYIFRSQIGTYIWRIRCRSPMVWNNIRIKFPKGMIYREKNKSIVFFHWENPKGFLYLRKMDLNTKDKDYLISFLKKKEFHILETAEINFKNYQSFLISYLDNKSKDYYSGIYVVPRNVCILYEGDRKTYEDFRSLIDDIEFL